MRKPRRKSKKRLLLYPLIACAVWCFGLACIQNRIIFARQFAAAPQSAPPDGDIVILSIQIDGGGSVPAWYVPASGVSAESPAPLVIFFHGNAVVMHQGLDIARKYNQFGCSVLLPEYRGYGLAGGSPSQESIVADMVRFYDEIVARPEIDADRVVFHGQSLGGGVAAATAAHRKPAAMILESTFSSIVSVANRLLIPSFLVRHPFRTDRVVKNTDTPLLIFHGVDDLVISIREGHKLRDLAPSATYIEYDGGHTICQVPGLMELFWTETENLLRRANIL